MAENERMMKEMEEKWEEKLAASEKENKVKIIVIALITRRVWKRLESQKNIISGVEILER